MALAAAQGAGAPPTVFDARLFSGRTCLVTGGGSGIGYAITSAFLRHGAACYITSRSKGRIDAAVASLRAETGGKVSGAPADVRKPEDMRRVAQACIEELGSLDVLINCAAGNFLCPASGMSSRAFRTVMEIDTLGTFHATRAAFDAWMGVRGGVVVSITATLHWNAVPMQSHAGSAKAAVEAMMRHLAVEWGPHGIRTACVAPGPIRDTEGFRRLGGFLPPAMLEEARKSIPLRRMGEREDIANCCLFLASPAAAYVTGVTLAADGGAWMTGYEHRMWSAGEHASAAGEGEEDSSPPSRL